MVTRYGGARSTSLYKTVSRQRRTQEMRAQRNKHVRDDFVKAKGCDDCGEKLSHSASRGLGNDDGSKKV